MSRSMRPAVKISLLRSAALPLEGGCPGGSIDTGSKRHKDRVEMLNSFFFPSYHQAIPAFPPGNASARSNVNIMHAPRIQVLPPPDIVPIVGISAVNDDVILFDEREQFGKQAIHHGRRHHQPYCAWLGQARDQIL